MPTSSQINDKYIGILPSKATGGADSLAHGSDILDIAASFIRGLDYSNPALSLKDQALKVETVRELQSWELGEAMGEVLRYLDVGLAVAEVCSMFRWSPGICECNLMTLVVLSFAQFEPERHNGRMYHVRYLCV